MSATIYVVMGNSGEYSDFQEWIVDAWHTEDKAKARVAELEHLIRVHRVAYDDFRDVEWNERQNRTEAMRNDPNGDPGFDVDYTGTNYHYCIATLKP
jgi:hypothetical protein